MHWRKTAIEKIPPDRFRPQFCPNTLCRCHAKNDPSFRWVRKGFYTRKCDRRTIPKFKCKSCGRYFSQQSFAATYYMKRPKLLQPIAAGLVAGSAARQTARTNGCSHTTVVRLNNRLGRHAMLVMSLAIEHLESIREPVVFDHFETFQYCQEMQLGIGTPVGADSWFIYDLDPVPHRRGGKMTAARKAKLLARIKRWGGIPAGSYRKSVIFMIKRLLRKVPSDAEFDLISDAQPTYKPAVRAACRGRSFTHRVCSNPVRGEKDGPRSRQALARNAAMFPVDQLHRLLRHSDANHKRETIAFGRRANAILLRCFLFIVWRNFVKDRSERKPTGTTPAMKLGLTQELWNWSTVLSRRLFPGRLQVPQRWMKLYRQEMQTPAVGINQVHALRNAF
jgi:transposase-like protein